MHTAVETKEEDGHQIGVEIDRFIGHIESLEQLLMGMIVAIQHIADETFQKVREFENEHCEVIEEDDGRRVKVPNSQYRAWQKRIKTFEKFNTSRELLPRSVMVSIVAQYDAYLGRLIKAIFTKMPQLLNSSERKITFEALAGFKSIEEAKEHILEKEIESILRSSHAEQFKWMEKVYEVTLTTDLAIWPAFVELTERRNLFVHTDGVVSSQYLQVCRTHKCKVPEDTVEGTVLGVPQAYFESSVGCMYQIAIMLGHVLWRKLFPNERQRADSHLVKITYELIDSGRYDLAIKLLDFACTTIKKFSSEVYQLTLTVNRAQAYKWNGDKEKCDKIMKAVDWSAKGDLFKLGHQVLSEDWEKAGKTMRRIGSDGPVGKHDYRDWPLFKEFRQQNVFGETYRDIFAEDFNKVTDVSDQEPDPPVHEAVEPPSMTGNIAD